MGRVESGLSGAFSFGGKLLNVLLISGHFGRGQGDRLPLPEVQDGFQINDRLGFRIWRVISPEDGR